MLDILILNCLLVGITVAIHYEFVSHSAVIIPKLCVSGRSRILVGTVLALCAHILEIWVFAFGYYLSSKVDGLGSLSGNFSGTLLDSVYFSMTTYTTLGFGDITPIGDIRFLAGIESLTGLVLITWTASFLFLEMQRHWQEK